MFSNALFEIQKEYGAMRDSYSLPTLVTLRFFLLIYLLFL